ncbi:UDP-glucose 6-dehydrogenase YwqF [Pontiella desulfatans]|uniref:UDP-glucose 6-dehydrogenase n=1 Tax=Pontiella desulfatans TaxID=2750659 RepID=A0A6C2U440_PONDE|nr:UDP-glucose/GDP-mannose dehydrogenase family protein [Pontiella desulfatans]VGO14828.1 UDP-glucose 6-dehydrogenase YwqF [Pontiella desulfatans]
MKISVVGTGYVGLVSGVCLADVGHEVVCIDNNAAKVEQINAGKSPIYEKGLDELLQKHIGTTLLASTDLSKAVVESDLTLIAVGTPFDGDLIDLQYVKQVSREIGTALKNKDGYHVVVVKSTVVPGTTDEVVLPLLEEHSGKKAGAGFGVGMNPEFLREGEAIGDFQNPDRIVLGGIDDATRAKLAEVYAPFPETDKVMVNNKTAEMIKYASNSLLATLISFSNEIGNLCSSIGGIDALDVMNGVHLDKRFSPILETGERIKPVMTTYLEAGCGFGGSCFPKDVKALIAHGVNVGEPMSLLKSVIDINKHQPMQVMDRLRKHFPELEGKKVAVLGLAFKPGTDDMRESPAIPIVNELVAAKAVVTAFDPVAQEEAQKIFTEGRVVYCDSIEQTVSGVDAILLLTRWPEFKALPEILKGQGASPLLVDGRRLLPKDCVETYEGIGI